MSSSTAPTVPERPNDSTQANKPTINLQLQQELRVKASIEYQKAVCEQFAKDSHEIIKKHEKQEEDAAAALCANQQEMTAAKIKVEATEAMVEAKALATETLAEDAKVLPSTDLQLFETLIYSMALTRSNLISAALKPLQELKVPDIKHLAKDLKRDAVYAFQNQ